MAKVCIKKRAEPLDNADFEAVSKEELIARLKSLHAENAQLKNIIHNSGSKRKSQKRITKPFDFSKCSFRHILLKFYYLGWDYQGFATQDDTTNTIEYNIFQALRKSCIISDRKFANYHRCGRTDKGVSAFSQVISLDVRSKLKKEEQHEIHKEIDYCKIINRLLPENIRCIGWCPVDENFSARFDCKQRCYKYFFPKGNLNIEKMEEASKHLLGTHDFRNFCKMDVGNGVVEFTRNVQEIHIETCSKQNTFDGECTMYVITIIGQAFLWHQIRCIMGILFLVGQEKELPGVILELLDVQINPRKPDYNMANEIPLILYECEYSDDLKWYYSLEALKPTIAKLEESWAVASVKTSMTRNMLDDLKTLRTTLDRNEQHPDWNSKANRCLSDVLVDGVRSKLYVPLMKRQRCKSLQEKMEHFSKRGKIEVTQLLPESDKK